MSENNVIPMKPEPPAKPQILPPDVVAFKLRGLARILTAASISTGRGGGMSAEDTFNHEATFWLAEAIRDLAQDLDGMTAAEATASYEGREEN